jgi:L-ascorbate metabolism protein UlaG (beta-lactamase superfamily)
MIKLTLVGGPTVLIEIPGLRLLTDPTFDGPGSYAGGVMLTKTRGPALRPDQLGAIDAVLLSHDQHADNFDTTGRAFALGAKALLTTSSAAARLDAGMSLAPWQAATVKGERGQSFTITATPARHGPPGAEKILGEVIGFMVSVTDGPDLVYITGDTVFYEGLIEVARRFAPKVVVAFAGAAKTRGAFNLTMGNNDLLELAATFPEAEIAVAHNCDWAHFSEGPADVMNAAEAFGLGDRLKSLRGGEAIEMGLAPLVEV